MKDVQGVQDAAAIDARVKVSRGRADGQAEHDHSAEAHRDGRRPGIGAARVKDDRRVRTALVGPDPFGDHPTARLLLTLEEDPDVDGQLPGSGHRAGDVQQRQEVALVVRRPAAVDPPVADRRLERRRVPQLLRAGTLDVVVAVDQDRRRVGDARPKLAHGQRVALAEADQLALPARGPDPVDGPHGGRLEVLRPAPAGRDRRDAQPVGQVLQQLWVHEGDPSEGRTARRCSAQGRILGPPGAIAQLGERLLCKQEVTGSIPVGSIDRRGLQIHVFWVAPAVARGPLLLTHTGAWQEVGGSRSEGPVLYRALLANIASRGAGSASRHLCPFAPVSRVVRTCSARPQSRCAVPHRRV